MLWSALLLPPGPDATPPFDDQLRGLAIWALHLTPRTAIVDDAVVMEVEASARLFGGRRALRDRVVAEAADLGVLAIAWSSTSLAALAFARAGRENGIRGALTALLDLLPMDTLSAVRPHRTTLAQLGCRTLGDVRALPTDFAWHAPYRKTIDLCSSTSTDFICSSHSTACRQPSRARAGLQLAQHAAGMASH